MRDSQYLFSTGDLFRFRQARLAEVRAMVEGMPRAQFQTNNEVAIADHLFAQLELTALSVDEATLEYETEDCRIEVGHDPRRFRNWEDGNSGKIAGVRYAFSLDVHGTVELWHLRPSTWSSLIPMGEIRTQRDGATKLIITLEFPNDSIPGGAHLKDAFEKMLGNVKEHIAYVNKDVDSFNKELLGEIKERIAGRRLALGSLDAIAESIGIPRKQPTVSGAITPITLPEKGSNLAIPPSRKPEPGLSEAQFESILKIIRDDGAMMERTRNTYSKMNEESLRDILLSHLNSHYPGKVTSETFRRVGKTDIHLQVENLAAFIAECKMWSGESALGATLDQLLSYSTWRDSKLAIVLFNTKVAEFTSLHKKVQEYYLASTFFRKEIASQPQGEWRFMFCDPSDPDSLKTVHIFFFDLYLLKKASKGGS